MRVSKSLTNVLVLDVNKESDKFLKKNLEELGIKILNVNFPEKLENITKSFIERNWKNITKYNILEVILVRLCKRKSYNFIWK